MSRRRDGGPGETLWVMAAVALSVTGIVVSVWRPTAPPLAPVATDLDTFPAAVLAAVDAYRAPRAAIALVALAIGVLVPVAVVATARGRRLAARLAGEGRTPVRRAAALAFVVAALTSLATLPLATWVALVHDRTWGFRVQGSAAWFRDWLVVSVGRWTLVAAGMAVLVAAARRWPRSWPYRLTVLATAVAGVGTMIHPVVLLPTVLPMRPLAAVEQPAAVREVLLAADEDALPIYLGEESRRSTRVNALAVGLGPTARIVLYDNLLALPSEQVASVVAHEVAHHQHRDLLRGVLLVAGLGLPGLLVMRAVIERPRLARGLGARGPGDARIVALAMVVLAVLQLGGRPVTNLVSRQLESAADARAVEITGDPATLLATTRVFTLRDLADPAPGRWVTVLLRTHPSGGERIRQAAAIAARDGRDLPALTTFEEAEHDAAQADPRWCVDVRSHATAPVRTPCAPGAPVAGAARPEDRP